MILCFKRNKSPIWFLNNFVQFSMQYITTIRSSRSQMFFEKSVLKVCNILQLNACVGSLFVVKLQAWRPVTLLKRDQISSCEYYEVFKKILFKEHHRWLLLYFKFIGNLMTYINREIDDIYFQYNTFCLNHVFLHFFRCQFCWS